jgi:preprotein translocase subunit SecG
MVDGLPAGRIGDARARRLRNIWTVFVGLTLGLFVLAIPERFDDLVVMAQSLQVEVEQTFSGGVVTTLAGPGVYPWLVIVLEVGFVGFFALTSTGIAWGRGDVPVALFFSAVFFGYPVWVTPTLDALELAPPLDVVASLTQAGGLLLALLFFLLFPDGRFMPRTTRWLALFWCVYCLSWGLWPDAWFSLINPFTATTSMFLLLMFGWTSGMVAQYMRYRADADPVQRRQTKWVLVVIGGAIAGYGGIYTADLVVPDEGRGRLLLDLFGTPLFWLLAMPIAIALTGAMIRHHLFDVNAVVNRTMVYATLTAVLATAYVVLSVVIGALVPVAEDSPIVVTFSTLVVVTLFKPLRERVQDAIDQRFYRSKYDAARVVSRFGDRLRHETNLPDLTSDLCGVVAEAMRPAQVWLWMPGDSKPDEGREPAPAS